MIFWFLRLFPAFRQQEIALRVAGERMTRLEDDLRWMKSTVSDLQEQLKESRAEEKHSSHLVADFFSQWVSGKKLYASTPDLPADSPDQQIVRRDKVHARHIQQQAQQQAIQKAICDMEADLGIDS